jgi:hypothetical protein
MPQAHNTDDWWIDPTLEAESEYDDSPPIKEYDISANPNDFNVLTIMSFLEAGSALRS